MRADALEIKERLALLGIKPSRDKGQNFLIDLAALESIILFGKPRPEEKILEIGGGLGALTAELAAITDITIVEVEPVFCEEIQKRYPSCTVVEADIRTFDLTSLGAGIVVFGNLPYALSTDIILYLVQHHFSVARAVLLLQKEFSERLFAKPGTKKYGTLSVHVQLYATVYPGPVIAGDCFYPEASVESQVIEVQFLLEPRFPVKDSYIFSRIVSAAFSKRRRKILNSVLQSKSLEKNTFTAALTEAGISPDTRAEDISVEDYVKLANAYVLFEKKR